MQPFENHWGIKNVIYFAAESFYTGEYSGKSTLNLTELFQG